MARSTRTRGNPENVTQESKGYWDDHPIGVEPFQADLASSTFYDAYIAYYDRFYDYKCRVFQYEKYAGRRVIEIGCGLGIDSIKFAKAGARLTCVDLSETSVQCTRKLLQQRGFAADVHLGNIERLDFPDGSFDVAYAYGVLQHVADQGKAISEIYRVLKPGGEALVVLYHARSWYWLMIKLTATNVESETGDPPIVNVHTVREARELFKCFRQVQIVFERFPRRTRRRKGWKGLLFNWLVVPAFHMIPRPLIRPFGWHLIVKAIK